MIGIATTAPFVSDLRDERSFPHLALSLYCKSVVTGSATTLPRGTGDDDEQSIIATTNARAYYDMSPAENMSSAFLIHSNPWSSIALAVHQRTHGTRKRPRKGTCIHRPRGSCRCNQYRRACSDRASAGRRFRQRLFVRCSREERAAVCQSNSDHHNHEIFRNR